MRLKIRQGFALVCIGALASVASACSSDDSSSGSSGSKTIEVSESIKVTGKAIPVFGGSGEDPEPPKVAAPALSGSSFDRSAVSIEPGADDKPMAVVVVSHSCPHCQAEVPRLAELLNGGSSIEGVEVRFVSTRVSEEADNSPPSAWLTFEGIEAPVLADDKDGTAMAAYGVGGFPTTVFIGKDGKVVGRTSGEASIEDTRALFKKYAAS